MFKTARKQLSEPVDIAFLVYFRFFSAIFITFELINQFFTGDYLNYLLPAYHFNYAFFPWLHHYPNSFAIIVMACIIISGPMVAIGWRYRFFSIIFFLSNTALFLMEKTEYVNHAYLYCLVAFFLVILPANRALSVDVKRTGIRFETVPKWVFYLLLFQISVVYFYGGVAKLHNDWFEARAMTDWVKHGPVFKSIGDLLINEYTPWILSYGGVAFDLLIVPLLLYKRTRIFAFILACGFHLSNVINFGLATFPWFSIMMTALFFGPSFPRKIPFYRFFESSTPPIQKNQNEVSKPLMIVLVLYCTFHLLTPLRHYLYPGESIWTEEGHRFSWHMMLRGKHARTSFLVQSGDTLMHESGRNGLSEHQYYKMSYDPELILDYAHYLRDEYESRGYENVKVYARSMVSLNGRSYQPFIDKSVDLAAEDKSICAYPWIMPFPESD